MSRRVKDFIMVIMIAAVIAVIDLLDGNLQWRMDIGVFFLILLVVFWMRSLKRTRAARREICRRMEASEREER